MITDQATKPKLIEFIENHHGKLAILFYFSSFLVFALLISENLCDKTYFSDNSLLPGFVTREFNARQQTLNNLNELRSLKLTKDDNLKHQTSQMPVEWLVNKFQSFGLQVYTQQFKLNYPFDQRNQTGTNVYAVFKAPRALGTEVLVLSSPLRVESKGKSNDKSTLPGISLLISLAEYFSTKNYWSKDLIFLIYEHDLIGCEAWLNAYYNLNDDNNEDNLIQFSKLEERGGIIQAAINLEITSEKTPNLDIRIEGLNGQLTNLDLFNVVVELASRESIDATFHQLSHLFAPDQLEVWIEYAKSIGLMMKTQASMFTNGAHGLFQKRSIQSLTLVAEEDENDQDYLKADLMQIGKVIEGIFRSCNNLIERFNRSYWFYLLPSTRRYLSIGFYMIPFALMVLPSILKALVLYLKTTEKHKSVIDTFWTVLPQVIWIHLYGLVIASFPFIIQNSSKLQSHFNFQTEELLFYSLLLFMSSLMFSPIINHNENNDRSLLKNVGGDQAIVENSEESNRLKMLSIQHYIALLELALVLICLSLVNISLAFCLASIYIPIMCSISLNESKTTLQKLINCLHKLLLIIVNPFTLLYLCILVKSIYLQSNQSPVDHLNNSFAEQKQLLVSLIEDWYLFGNLAYLIGSVTLFPLWLQFWYLL